MGKRIIETVTGRSWAWVSELPRDAVADLPDELDGATFLDRWKGTDDDLTTIDPAVVYPVRAAAGFGVAEHARCEEAVELLSTGRHDELGLLLAASHAAYDAMGLGHLAATARVDEASARPGVIGARSSGGGSGGTIVIVCHRGALDDVEGLLR
jgi:galactokinase